MWSTGAFPEAEQLPVWRELVCEAFVPVSVERDGDGGFAGSVRSRAVGPLGLSRIRSQAQRVERDERAIRRQAGDVYFLNLPLTSGAVVSQGGRAAILDAGDFALIDSTRPFELTFPERFDQVSIALPAELVAAQLAVPAEATAIRVQGDAGVGAVAAATILGLVRAGGEIDRDAAAALADQVAGLVALALAGVRTSSTATRGLLLQAALDEVERSLGDPELTPSAVAERLGISTRYLHRLFADRGPSFGRWLLLRRLERADRALTDPRRAHWSIAEIAYEHGFSDPSHFSRAYRSRYAVAPREVRRLGLRSADPSGAQALRHLPERSAGVRRPDHR